MSIGIYTCLRFIKLWKTNQLYKFNFRKISLILNKIKINLFQSILCYSNYKNICRNKLCNKLCTLALPLTFKMNAIKILILISNGGKIYILSPSEKNGYISWRRKKKYNDCIALFFVFIYEGEKINVKMFYFSATNCPNSFRSWWNSR